jgi:hypothetical protein
MFPDDKPCHRLYDCLLRGAVRELTYVSTSGEVSLIDHEVISIVRIAQMTSCDNECRRVKT